MSKYLDELNAAHFYRTRAITSQRMRDMTTVQRQADADQQRDARIGVIESALRAGVANAPDLFGEIDCRSMATRIVDELIGA